MTFSVFRGIIIVLYYDRVFTGHKEVIHMSKNLVTFFSAGGVTAKYAKALAKESGSELFEIMPETPYTEADIKWTNPLSRCNKEKIGNKDVEIADRIENFEEYDTVFIGFPIWYYGAPNIIKTFIKNKELFAELINI